MSDSRGKAINVDRQIQKEWLENAASQNSRERFSRKMYPTTLNAKKAKSSQQ